MSHSPSWEAVSQLVKNLPSLYGTQRFITMFIRVCPLFPILNQMNPAHILTPCFSNIYLILSSHLRLGLPGVLLHSCRSNLHCLRHANAIDMWVGFKMLICCSNSGSRCVCLQILIPFATQLLYKLSLKADVSKTCRGLTANKEKCVCLVFCRDLPQFHRRLSYQLLSVEKTLAGFGIDISDRNILQGWTVIWYLAQDCCMEITAGRTTPL